MDIHVLIIQSDHFPSTVKFEGHKMIQGRHFVS